MQAPRVIICYMLAEKCPAAGERQKKISLSCKIPFAPYSFFITLSPYRTMAGTGFFNKFQLRLDFIAEEIYRHT